MVMKQIQSTNEGVFLEITRVPFTEEELLEHGFSKDEINSSEFKNTGRIEKLEVGDSAYSEFYNTIKPELREGDSYEFISLDLIDDDGYFSGILNCRINGEHIQVRF